MSSARVADDDAGARARGRDEGEKRGRADALRGDSSMPRAVETTKRRDADRRARGNDTDDAAGLLDALLRGFVQESEAWSSRTSTHDIAATTTDTNGLFHDIFVDAFAFERYDVLRYCSSCKQNLSADSFPGWHRKTCSSCLQSHGVARRRRRKKKRLQSE